MNDLNNFIYYISVITIIYYIIACLNIMAYKFIPYLILLVLVGYAFANPIELSNKDSIIVEQKIDIIF